MRVHANDGISSRAKESLQEEGFQVSTEHVPQDKLIAYLENATQRDALATRLGLLDEFWLVGPFDNERGAGFRRSLPPEQQFDLDGLQGNDAVIAFEQDLVDQLELVVGEVRKAHGDGEWLAARAALALWPLTLQRPLLRLQSLLLI